MDASTRFTTRSNAKRAAERAIVTGAAPSIDYGIRASEDGKFEILWRTGDGSKTTKAIETEIADATADAEPPAAAAIDDETPAPANAAAQQAELPELVLAEIDAEVARYRETKITRATAKQARQQAKQAKQRQPRAATQPRPRKANAVDEAAARGVMPDKPVIASPTNQHYQKRLDRLAELAAADDWAAIAAYEVKGGNTYAQLVARYRDQLLTAHAASAPAEPA